VRKKVQMLNPIASLIRAPLCRAAAVLTLGFTLLPQSAEDAAPLQVATTTTMITGLVQQVGGDRVAVSGLMGPGVDPHLYKLSASDVTRLQRAQAVFYNGLLLEGRMADLFTRLARAGGKIYAVSEASARSHARTRPATIFSARLRAS
jgi:manganese/zinc/iron transport system substrate-binding protein